jgi:hypothetical protein
VAFGFEVPLKAGGNNLRNFKAATLVTLITQATGWVIAPKAALRPTCLAHIESRECDILHGNRGFKTNRLVPILGRGMIQLQLPLRVSLSFWLAFVV